MVAFLPAMARSWPTRGSSAISSGKHSWRAIAIFVRVGGNVRLLKDLGCSPEAGHRLRRPDQMAAAHQPPLVLRLVVVNDGKKTWYWSPRCLTTSGFRTSNLGSSTRFVGGSRSFIEASNKRLRVASC